MVGDMVAIQKQTNDVVVVGQSGKYTNGEMVVLRTPGREEGVKESLR